MPIVLFQLERLLRPLSLARMALIVRSGLGLRFFARCCCKRKAAKDEDGEDGEESPKKRGRPKKNTVAKPTTEPVTTGKPKGDPLCAAG